MAMKVDVSSEIIIHRPRQEVGEQGMYAKDFYTIVKTAYIAP